MGGFVVYMLRCADGSLYTGCTADLERRCALHSAGKGSKYVASRLPFALAYFERSASKSAAMKRECEIKGLSRADKLKLCASKKKS
ncbi:MAG: GIY-YIG nuclease family protein [Nitrososphaerota archaeon]|nr:GIY-YIG nuclease family protein [Nitrososphaerota archaeon]